MARPLIRWLLLLAIVVLTLYILSSCQTLPIYQLAPPNVSTTSPPIPVGSLLGPGVVTVSETADRVYFRLGPRRVEVYKASGGFWYEDSTKLWDPEIVPQHLPDSSQLRPPAMAISTRGRSKALPSFADTGFTTFEFERILPTLVQTLDTAGTSTTVTLDWQVGYGARVAERPRAKKFAVTGGGGDFKIDYGDSGVVIGFHGVWREIRRVARRERVIGRRDADRRYLQQVGGNVVFARPTIAYYSAPAPFAQDVLYPVYVYSGTKVIDGDSIPLPNIMVPATRSGDSPASTATTPSTKRMKDERPRPGSTDPEHSEEARIGSFSSKPGFEVAASWIGTSDGLLNAEANVTGLLDALVADDWVVNFNWGDADALHSDWNVNRDQWADATDLIFYTGHAKLDSWKLVSAVQNIPDVLLFQKLTYMDAASYPFGAQDLEWILIAACGPLQDRTINPSPNNDENAIERWRGAFDGLHILLGYGSVSFDYGEEGRRFATHALEGQTIIDSWFRAAAETQPPTNGRPEPNGPNVYAGAMWAEDSAATSPVNDHLWGHGSVAPDPKSPIRFKIMWVPT